MGPRNNSGSKAARKGAVSPRGNPRDRSNRPVPPYVKKSRASNKEEDSGDERESGGEDSVYDRRTLDKSSSYRDSKMTHRANEENYSGRQYKDFIDEEDSNEQSQSQRRSMEISKKVPTRNEVRSRSENSRDSERERQNQSDDQFWDGKDSEVDLDSQAVVEERVIEAVTERVDARLDQFERKMLNIVEKALESVKESGSRLVSGSQLANAFKFTQTQRFVLGSFVRNKMFRIIKVLDKQTLSKEGKTIIEKCKCVTGISGVTTNSMYEGILKAVRWYHNKHKGHVRGKIRELAAGKLCV
jgi:hypothetical protein